MTQEEKELLFKDLCARLPYGVKVKCASEILTLNVNWLKVFQYHLDEIKPYLRSLSSMTAEEEYEYHQCKNIDYFEFCKMEHTEMLEATALCFSRAIDWLNKKGFDYLGLIPMGLALEATEDMYKN